MATCHSENHNELANNGTGSIVPVYFHAPTERRLPAAEARGGDGRIYAAICGQSVIVATGEKSLSLT